MTKLKLLLTFGLITFFILCLKAEPTVINSSNKMEKQTVFLKREKNVQPNGGYEFEPNARCYYLDGELCFSFLASEGKAKATVISSTSPVELSKSSLSIYPFNLWIGSRPGYYQIVLETAKGNYYVGELIIEE